MCPVALRKESVDRNVVWAVVRVCEFVVALRKESVDRNLLSLILLTMFICRSPQGERG